MFGWKRKKDRKTVRAEVEKINEPLRDSQLSTSLDDNISLFDRLFKDVDIMLSRRFHGPGEGAPEYCIYFSDGVVDSMLINEHIIKPLLLAEHLVMEPGVFEAVRDEFVMMNDIKETTEIKDIVEAITYGDTLLLVENCNRALILSSKNFSLRGIGEPEGEKVLNGPREGFTEGIMLNLSMVRRRLRTNELKLKFRSMGRQTRTTVCICYMENIVNKKILKELYRRLDTIDIDGVLDANYLTEHIAESSFMGFTTAGYTERPDVVVARLLEGRIAILVDGSPITLTVPYLLVENFQSNEDYYMNWYYATFSRVLRFLGFLFTVTIPAVYIAIVSYHHEILPAPLMINFTNERASVPLPASIEAFIMLLVFDILRETGVRMPSQVGQALSIVGALVIGQAAVEAKLVAAPMIIVVAFTGITNLLVPRLTAATLFCRYFFLLLTANFGLCGLVVGMSLMLIHMLNLQSFGVPVMMPMDNLTTQQVKDTFVRAPWPRMLTRITPLTGNIVRSRPGKVDQKEGGPR